MKSTINNAGEQRWVYLGPVKNEKGGVGQEGTPEEMTPGLSCTH